MSESPASPSTRLVTLDLDDLYRRRDEAEERVARETQALASIRGAIQVVEEALGLTPRDGPQQGAAASSVVKARPTHRAMLTTVLAEAEKPMGVREMIDGVHARFGVTIPRTSVSPLLRKLADRGEVKHDGENARWAIGDIDRVAVEGEIVRFRGPRTAKREVA